MKKMYYGKETIKAHENFPFDVPHVHKELIVAIAQIKLAAANAHLKAREMDSERAAAIIQASQEVVDGTFDDQFTLPAIQGGAGTSIHMNVNEVIASRATEILSESGKNISVHPNDHVNMGQSTNDVNPSALKMACYQLGTDVIVAGRSLASAFEKKAREYKNVMKLGRTHLQDAVPITAGDELNAWAETLSRSVNRVTYALTYLSELNMGGTAVGNGINASHEYISNFYKELEIVTRIAFRQAENKMSQTSSQTDFVFFSQALTSLVLDASKIASDIRILTSGPNGGVGEIKIAEIQSGSSIMPGKVNPVMPETMNQLYYCVSGNNLSIEHAAHGSQLELGVMLPVICDRLIRSLKLTRDVFISFETLCIRTLEVNVHRCHENLERSTAYATLLSPTLGYDVVSEIVKEAVKTGTSIREVIIGKKLLDEEAFDALVRL